MWVTAVITIAGLITGMILWLRQYLKSNTQISELRDMNTVASERLEAADKQAEVDRTKRKSELDDEVTQILKGDDATAALNLLRKQFPKRDGTTPHS